MRYLDPTFIPVQTSADGTDGTKQLFPKYLTGPGIMINTTAVVDTSAILGAWIYWVQA